MEELKGEAKNAPQGIEEAINKAVNRLKIESRPE